MKCETFVVRWYVPALSQWIDVATCRTLEEANSSALWFRKKMSDCWKGDLKIGIVRIVEEEMIQWS